MREAPATTQMELLSLMPISNLAIVQLVLYQCAVRPHVLVLRTSAFLMGSAKTRAMLLGHAADRANFGERLVQIRLGKARSALSRCAQ